MIYSALMGFEVSAIIMAVSYLGDIKFYDDSRTRRNEADEAAKYGSTDPNIQMIALSKNFEFRSTNLMISKTSGSKPDGQEVMTGMPSNIPRNQPIFVGPKAVAGFAKYGKGHGDDNAPQNLWDIDLKEMNQDTPTQVGFDDGPGLYDKHYSHIPTAQYQGDFSAHNYSTDNVQESPQYADYKSKTYQPENDGLSIRSKPTGNDLWSTKVEVHTIPRGTEPIRKDQASLKGDSLTLDEIIGGYEELDDKYFFALNNK